MLLSEIMKRVQYFTLSLLLSVILSGCSEVFYPQVHSDSDILVVEGLITNGSGPFVVKLRKAVKYNSDSVSANFPVTKAKLTVSDSENHLYPLTEGTSGNYYLPSSFTATTGSSYQLHIQTADGSLYESAAQKLLPPQPIDSTFAENATEKYLDADDNLKTRDGINVLANLFENASGTETKPFCRFSGNLTVQYRFADEVPHTDAAHLDVDNCSSYIKAGWANFPLDETINITDENTYSSDSRITNHKICFIPFLPSAYNLNKAPWYVKETASCYYYLKINQYTLNEDTYQFYKAAKDQLSASGKIFDPAVSQLEGNIKCISDPSKTALGLFEASSVNNSAYLLARVVNSSIASYKVDYINIPSDNQYKFKVWNCKYSDYLNYIDRGLINPVEYEPIADPAWWGHSIF